MGFLDFLVIAADLVDLLMDHSTSFNVQCTTLELFELNTIWKGTARIHGAGNHIATKKVDFSTTLKMPAEDEAHRTRRSILRERLLTWASETFADGEKLPKDAIILNPSENCLSCEGYVKQVGNKWILTTNISEAIGYGAYKLVVCKGSNIVGHDELDDLFQAPTVAHISSVEVHDGF